MLPVDRFKAFIEQHDLLSADSKVLAAVSGGMDSVLMAQLLCSAGYAIGIAHSNFNLRGDEANADEDFTRELAKQLRVPFYSVKFDTDTYARQHKVSIQMAARELRYNWFRQLCETHSYDAIALAHHQNDTIETILLNLTRGTGIAGLHGILPKNGDLVRPLLFLSRQEIADIVARENISYREDSSNASTKYARNKIRHEVIPHLKALNPDLEHTFENNLRTFRELETLLDLKVIELRETLPEIRGADIYIKITDVEKLHPKRLLLYKLLQPFGFSEAVTDDLLSALHKHSGRKFESNSHLLVLDRSELIITSKTADEPVPTLIEGHVHSIRYGAYQLTILHDDAPLVIKDNLLAVSVDADKLSYPLTLRPWRQGDHFYPLGMSGSKKLSDLFVGQKIPLHQKEKVPVLANANGDIIWVGGYRLDNRYRVTDATKKVTIFELIKL